jgi:hypothetical protein
METHSSKTDAGRHGGALWKYRVQGEAEERLAACSARVRS